MTLGWFPDPDDKAPLAPARGIVHGILAGAVLWLIIIGIGKAIGFAYAAVVHGWRP